MTAQSNGLPAVSSNLVNLVPGTAGQLAVIAAPSDVTVGLPFEVDVSVEDALGNVQTAYNGNVTLALAINPAAPPWEERSPWPQRTAWPRSPA